MNKVWLIIEREYITRVRKRSFLLTTILAPVGFMLFFLVLIFVMGHGNAKKRIAVIDKSGYNIHIRDTTSLYFFKEDTSLAYLSLVYKNLNYNGILYIPPIRNINNPDSAVYRSDEQLGIISVGHIESQLSKELIGIKAHQANISQDLLDDINNTQMKVATKVFGEEGETTVSAAANMGVGYIMGFVIYAVLFIYGNMVMKGVAEEKTNRIVEVIISSVKPFQLMLGKIIGVGAVGLTQFFLWGILITLSQFVLAIVFSANFAEMREMANNPAMQNGTDKAQIAQGLASLAHLHWGALFAFFIFFFLAGFLLYGALFAAVGAAANESDDVQSLNFFISIPIIISMIIMVNVVQDPNSNLAVGASIFPFTAPIVMMARIPFNPPVWQIIMSMVTLIGGFVLTTWLAGRIYRVGILMYGKKVTIREIGKWLFYS